MDLFDIDFHIFTVIKFLFNLGVRIKYIYIHVKYYLHVITKYHYIQARVYIYIYLNLTTKLNKNFITVKM